MKLREFKGLGPKSEEQLAQVGIITPEELRQCGAVPVFATLCERTGASPSLNFLYALVGALEDRNWQDVAKTDRGRLLLELEGNHALEKILGDK